MRGQAFTVFKMLIAAVFAVTLLLIVYNVVSNIPPAPITGDSMVRDLTVEAHNAPGFCFAREHVPFQKGDELSSENLKSFLSVDYFCVLESSYGGTFRNSDCPGCVCANCDCVAMEGLELSVSVKCPTLGKCTIYLGLTTCDQ
jgi:hypothetical protein